MEEKIKTGTLFAVGVGPGASGLITQLAADSLRACPVIAAPRTASGKMLALEIAAGAVNLSGKTILPLEHSMKRSLAEREKSYEKSEAALARVLDTGQDVALVNLGDVSIYASGQYLLERLEKKGYHTVMVPGIPSFCAAAARLGVSLTDMQSALHIVPGTENLSKALDWPGTKIIMKTGHELPKALEILQQKGLLGKSSLICDCGMKGEKLWPNLKELRPQEGETGYFALIIVKE